MSHLIVVAVHSCEFSQGHALSSTPTVTEGEEKKKRNEKKRESERRAAESLQFSVRLSDSPVRMNLPGRRSADGCPDG